MTPEQLRASQTAFDRANRARVARGEPVMIWGAVPTAPLRTADRAPEYEISGKYLVRRSLADGIRDAYQDPEFRARMARTY